MATKKVDVNTSDLIIKPVYKSEGRMNNYDLIYDESINQLRCGFYKNKLKDKTSTYDQLYEVEAGYEYRLDLISFKFYGTATLDWAIADANNISDPIKEVTAGTVLKIPARNII